VRCDADLATPVGWTSFLRFGSGRELTLSTGHQGGDVKSGTNLRRLCAAGGRGLLWFQARGVAQNTAPITMSKGIWARRWSGATDGYCRRERGFRRDVRIDDGAMFRASCAAVDEDEPTCRRAAAHLQTRLKVGIAQERLCFPARGKFDDDHPLRRPVSLQIGRRGALNDISAVVLCDDCRNAGDLGGEPRDVVN